MNAHAPNAQEIQWLARIRELIQQHRQEPKPEPKKEPKP